MRLFLVAVTFAAFCNARPVAAQQSPASMPTASSATRENIALSNRPAASPAARPARLACAPLGGQVFEPNGQALVGATLLVKGTHQVYVTDSEGKFQLTEPVYEGQMLTVGAAGYSQQDVSLDDCVLPRLVLERLPSAHIKRSGKRAGQVIRLDNRSTNLK